MLLYYLASMRDVLHPPLSVIATWTPNYIDPETRGPGIIVMAAILQAACYLTVFLRIWARLTPKFTFEWDVSSEDRTNEF